jgi:hypothetical protein
VCCGDMRLGACWRSAASVLGRTCCAMHARTSRTLTHTGAADAPARHAGADAGRWRRGPVSARQRVAATALTALAAWDPRPPPPPHTHTHLKPPFC